jgi:hypothetical protein
LAPINPADSLLKNLLLKPAPFQQVKPPEKMNFNQLLVNSAAKNIDHMPIAVLSGNSKMPVKKIGGYYTMPVKKIGSEDVPGDLKGFPMLPTLRTP